MKITEKLKGETVSGYALRIIKDNIVTLQLEPGKMVSEAELARELGVSRTPVREALISLSRSSVVEALPQRGYIVSLIDQSLVDESRFLRLVLEKAIIEVICNDCDKKDLLAIKENIQLQEFYVNEDNSGKILELDNDFHRLLFTAAKKENVYSIVCSLSTQFDRVRNLSISSKRIANIVIDHKQIFEAILNKDKEKAIEVIEFHLSRYQTDLIALKEEYPQYFK